MPALIELAPNERVLSLYTLAISNRLYSRLCGFANVFAMLCVGKRSVCDPVPVMCMQAAPTCRRSSWWSSARARQTVRSGPSWVAGEAPQ
jgi:hypothetical protein